MAGQGSKFVLESVANSSSNDDDVATTSTSRDVTQNIGGTIGNDDNTGDNNGSDADDNVEYLGFSVNTNFDSSITV